MLTAFPLIRDLSKIIAKNQVRDKAARIEGRELLLMGHLWCARL